MPKTLWQSTWTQRFTRSIAIAKKHLHRPHSLHEILTILSLTMFETTLINQLLTPPKPDKFSEFEPLQRSFL